MARQTYWRKCKITFGDKIALEEHVSTEAMSAGWDHAGEASRNGKDYMGLVERRLLDLPQRLNDMNE